MGNLHQCASHHLNFLYEIKLIYVGLLATALVAGCASNSTESKSQVSDLSLAPVDSDEEEQQLPTRAAEPIPVSRDSISPPSLPVAKIDWDKKKIKTATVKLQVRQFKSYHESLYPAIKKNGGYVAGEESFFADKKMEMVVTIKVPVQQFESLMNDMSSKDGRVIERNIKTEDVTGQVVDTKSRLEAKKQMRLKYLEFLKQSKNMAEILQVQAEINGLQEETEAAAGRIQYLSNQSAYSTIHLTFYEPLAGYHPTDNNPSFFTRAAAAFAEGTLFIKSILLGLITIWPILITGSLVYYLYKRNKPVKIIPARS